MGGVAKGKGGNDEWINEWMNECVDGLLFLKYEMVCEHSWHGEVQSDKQWIFPLMSRWLTILNVSPAKGS